MVELRLVTIHVDVQIGVDYLHVHGALIFAVGVLLVGLRVDVLLEMLVAALLHFCVDVGVGVLLAALIALLLVGALLLDGALLFSINLGRVRCVRVGFIVVTAPRPAAAASPSPAPAPPASRSSSSSPSAWQCSSSASTEWSSPPTPCAGSLYSWFRRCSNNLFLSYDPEASLSEAVLNGRRRDLLPCVL